MSDETLVAVFDTTADADAAISDLSEIVPASAITRHDAATRDGELSAEGREPGFWSRLFGTEPETDSRLYDRSIERGGVVVSVHASETQVGRVASILERHNPVDMNERAASYASPTEAGAYVPAASGAIGVAAGEVPAAGLVSSGSVAPPTAITPAPLPPSTAADGGPIVDRAAEGERLPLAEESLVVGKRAINRGTARVRRYVVETPVEQDVTLREEHVSIERRPASDGLTASDADFSDRTVEVTETAEEPVVSKTARVTEEVVVGKQATERTETVRDTVRRQDVRVESTPGQAAPRRRADPRPTKGAPPPM